jgi:hypothetical protein
VPKDFRDSEKDNSSLNSFHDGRRNVDGANSCSSGIKFSLVIKEGLVYFIRVRVDFKRV